MNFAMAYKNFKPGKNYKKRVEREINKLKKGLGGLNSAQVWIEKVNRGDQPYEVSLHALSGKKEFYSTATGVTPVSSIKAAKNKLERQYRRQKA